MSKYLQIIQATTRIAAQAAVASVLTYVVMAWIGGGKETSWAVISALYVVQPSIGGTLANAVARLAGTLLGTSIGLLGVYVLGPSTMGTSLSLVISALVLTMASGYHPGLRFGLIPAAVVILATNGDVVHSAWPRAGAIGLGALIGTVVSLLVFPKSAHREVKDLLAKALEDCARLMTAAVASVLGEGDDDTGRIDARIRNQLVKAAQMHGQSLRNTVRRQPRPKNLPLDGMREAVRSLWHTTLILHRTEATAFPDQAYQRVEGPLRAFGAAVSEQLGQYANAVKRGGAMPTGDRLHGLAEALRAAAFEAEQDGLGQLEQEALFTLAFTAREITAAIGEIRRLSESAQHSHSEQPV